VLAIQAWSGIIKPSISPPLMLSAFLVILKANLAPALTITPNGFIDMFRIGIIRSLY
jgi:hypothetical protein